MNEVAVFPVSVSDMIVRSRFKQLLFVDFIRSIGLGEPVNEVAVFPVSVSDMIVRSRFKQLLFVVFIRSIGLGEPVCRIDSRDSYDPNHARLVAVLAGRAQ